MLFLHLYQLVRVKLGDKTLWLDPTRAQQGGKIENMLPPYQRALVVDQATDRLAVNPERTMREPLRSVFEEWTVPSIQEPASLTVSLRE